MSNIRKGDFSTLAEDYTKYRPSYNQMIVDFIFSATGKKVTDVDAADIGAGTGIFTKLLSERGPKTLFAVEPNANMRSEGQKFMPSGVHWVDASAEATTLESDSFDLISMASSFHWPDTQRALAEFNRLLRGGGVFAALWNPRITELSKIETEVDGILIEKYEIKSRVSSGRSGITTKLSDILRDSKYFSGIYYCESMDKVEVSPAHYVGAWRSVNDVRSQLGEENFKSFIEDIEKLTRGLPHVEVNYLTRAWIAKK